MSKAGIVGLADTETPGELGVELLGEYEHHPSLHGYADTGCRVITF